MSPIIHPKPNDKEVILDPSKVIMSKTNHKGIIQYINNYFVEVCGYSEVELMGKPHNIIRHPDMPKVVFKLMWERLHKGESIFAVIKNLTKDGGFYWVVTAFETTYDKNGNILAHYARRKAAPKEVVEIASGIYERILAIEKHDIKLAEESFYEVLEANGLNYDEFFLEIAGMNESEVFNYFQSSEQNSNTTNEDIVIEMDTDLLNKQNVFEKPSLSIKDDPNNVKKILGEDIEGLKKQVDEIKTKTEPTNNSNGFLGNIFDEIKRTYDLDIKKEDS